MPWICSNARYATDTTQGYPHGPGNPEGSYFPTHIAENDDGGTLWLEYITDNSVSAAWSSPPLWLMWYDVNGNATIKHSAAFELRHIGEIVSRIIR